DETVGGGRPGRRGRCRHVGSGPDVLQEMATRGSAIAHPELGTGGVTPRVEDHPVPQRGDAAGKGARGSWREVEGTRSPGGAVAHPQLATGRGIGGAEE